VSFSDVVCSRYYSCGVEIAQGQLHVQLEQQIQEKRKVSLNVYGVIIHFTPPAHTRTGDWMTTVALIDESSFDGPNIISDKVVTMNIFATEIDRLPKFARAGDVLRAHRVDVQRWKDEIQLLGRARSNSSFVVVRKKYDLFEPTTDNDADSDEDEELANERWEQMSTAKQHYSFSAQDQSRCRKLWYWGQRQLSLYPVYSAKEQVSLASLDIDVESDKLFAVDVCGDLTAMVTAIIPVPNDKKSPSTPHGYLRLWDGTGPSLSDP